MVSSMMFESRFGEVYRALKSVEQEYRNIVLDMAEKSDTIQTLENQKESDRREINYYKTIRDKQNKELIAANKLLKEQLSSEQNENESLKNELTIRQAENDRLREELENSLCIQEEQEEMMTHLKDEKEKADHIIRTLLKKIEIKSSPTGAPRRQLSQNTQRRTS